MVPFLHRKYIGASSARPQKKMTQGRPMVTPTSSFMLGECISGVGSRHPTQMVKIFPG